MPTPLAARQRHSMPYAYAPGCQFVTFTAQDLASSTRQGDFQCQKLPTVELRGKVALPAGGQVMQVESMYVVRWAGKFFSVPGLSILLWP